MGLTGSVQLEVVIAPNETVKDTKVIGGHPILVNAALKAVKKWNFDWHFTPHWHAGVQV